LIARTKLITKSRKRNYLDDIILLFIYVKSMSAVSEIVFWISFSIIIYTYIGYAIVLRILVTIKKLFRKEISHISEKELSITLVIAAFNEEDVIEEKIKNSLAIDYPQHLLKVMFVTDGSTDKTVSLISRYPECICLHEAVRMGKVAAMNRALLHVQSDLVLFSDANGFLNKECLKIIVPHFSNQKVAAVTGEKKITKQSRGAVSEGEGLYWQYESALKKLDSELYTVVGAAGELFCIRTELYQPLPENIIIEDFVQSLLLCAKGYVVKYEPGAYSHETASFVIKDEMERKTRISAGGFQAMVFLKKLFNVFRYPVVFFQFFSHRILRWTLAPVSLVVLFVASLYIYFSEGSVFFGVFSDLQLIFYSAAFLGWYFAIQERKVNVLYVPFYFVFMNFCVFSGFVRYLSKNQDTLWKKAPRK
jgi:biofilm PGA synthesis N-glycosyltransferase PgaC